MRVLRALLFPFVVCALQANAQTEQDDKGILSGNDAALQTMGFVTFDASGAPRLLSPSGFP